MFDIICTIRLTAEEVDEITDLILGWRVGVGEVLFQRELVENGYMFALRVLKGKHNPYLSATVARVGSSIVLEAEAGDDPSPLGEYYFEKEGNLFTLRVIEGERWSRRGGELKLTQSNGRTIVCEEGNTHTWGSMIRVLDKHGFEIACWSAQEWADDPESVMGAIMACAAGRENMSLQNRMKAEVRRDLDHYLDESRCFNATLLAEVFLGEDDVDVGAEAEQDYFDAAAEVAEWAVKEYNLNE